MTIKKAIKYLRKHPEVDKITLLVDKISGYKVDHDGAMLTFYSREKKDRLVTSTQSDIPEWCTTEYEVVVDIELIKE